MYRCYGHHSCGSSLICLEYFDYVIRCGPYPQVPVGFKKKKSGIESQSRVSRPGNRFGSAKSGQAGIRGVTSWYQSIGIR